MNLLQKCYQWLKQLYNNHAIHRMDKLNGYQFEDYVAKLLVKHGYQNVHQTPKIHDRGLDVIAEWHGKTYGFQCKHYYKRMVQMKAVRQTFVGKNAYHVDVGILLTNREFDQHAIQLAKKLKVKLWNRERLLEMVKIK